jgi:putative transcriptional regulator
MQHVYAVNIDARDRDLRGWVPSVALLLHSIYAIHMSRKAKSEEPVVANGVEEIRSAQGISRQDLAQLVGVHYQTIGYIERGEYSPSLVLALQISRALAKPVEQLFWLDVEEKIWMNSSSSLSSS